MPEAAASDGDDVVVLCQQRRQLIVDSGRVIQSGEENDIITPTTPVDVVESDSIGEALRILTQPA
jgi:hypothetical protein